MTVVFTDVTGSTGLGEKLDPEAVRRIMERYFDADAQALERHGGTVEKYIGDAVMAVFGVPRLHEDDALRAVRAAVEMRAAMDELNARARTRLGVTLRIRIGVNTGEVVAGEPAGGQALVTGDAVNVAARLEQLRRPRRDPDRRGHAPADRNAVQAERVRPRAERKGKSAPLQAWRLQARGPGRALPARSEMPLVDRRDELAQLRDAFARCIRQRSCALFTIVGPAGIGKSRLSREFLRSVEGEAQVLTGRCLPYGEGITYWPLVEILRRVAGDDVEGGVRTVMAGDADADQVARLMAAVAGGSQQPANDGRRQLGGPAAVRDAARDAAAGDLVRGRELGRADAARPDRARGGVGPRVAADAPVQRPKRAAGAPLNLGRRVAERHHRPARAAVRRRLGRHGGAAAKRRAAGRGHAAAGDRLAGGNPLFVEQLLATMGTDQQPDVTALSTIHAVISARLDALPAGEREVLECASVMGKEFGGEPLSATLGGDAGEA